MNGRAILPLVLCALAAVPAVTGAETRTFVAVLNGGQVVPTSNSPAFGVGYFTYDRALKRLCYAISYGVLDGFETEAHLHDGKSGETDVVFYDLPLTNPKLGCVGPLSQKEERSLLRGRTYVNIHTDVWVAGEIRGQVLPAGGR